MSEFWGEGVISSGRSKPFSLSSWKSSFRNLRLWIIRWWFGQRPIRFLGELFDLLWSMWWRSTILSKSQRTHSFVTFLKVLRSTLFDFR